eukprot:195520-Pyramimonas_sp.AAC.1
MMPSSSWSVSSNFFPHSCWSAPERCNAMANATRLTKSTGPGKTPRRDTLAKNGWAMATRRIKA